MRTVMLLLMSIEVLHGMLMRFYEAHDYAHLIPASIGLSRTNVAMCKDLGERQHHKSNGMPL